MLYGSSGQGIELVCGGRNLPVGAVKLPFLELDRRAGIFLNGVDGSRVGATLVDGDLVWHAVQAEGA